MSTVAIASDSNSGITRHSAKKMGVHILPMTFFVNDKQYFEEVDLSQKDFYKLIANSKANVATSQPSPTELSDFSHVIGAEQFMHDGFHGGKGIWRQSSRCK